MRKAFLIFGLLIMLPQNPLMDSVQAQGRSLADNPQLESFFQREVVRLEQANDLTNYRTREEWEAARPALREELFDRNSLWRNCIFSHSRDSMSLAISTDLENSNTPCRPSFMCAVMDR